VGFALLMVANPRTPAQDLAKVAVATKVEHNPVKERSSLLRTGSCLNVMLNVSTQV
jgi:hypothetical protein